MMEIDERFFELQREGLSAAQIAAAMGVSGRTVTRWRRHAELTQEVPKFACHPAPAERLAEAERLLDDGASLKEVSRTLNMAVPTIHRHFPGRAWTRAQCADLAAAVNRAQGTKPQLSNRRAA